MGEVTTDLFLQAAEEDSVKLQHIIQLHLKKQDPFALSDVLTKLDADALCAVWDALYIKATNTVLRLEEAPDESVVEEMEKSIGPTLEAIVVVAMETLKLDDVTIPDGMLNTAMFFDGVLLELPLNLDKVAASIGSLAEAWYLGGHPGRDQVTPHVLVMLLEKTIGPKAKKVDVKRVWKLHERLQTFDFSHEIGPYLVKCLRHACYKPVYLESKEGQRFLAVALQLNAALTDELHKCMRDEIAASYTRAHVDAYGAIYYKAWSTLPEGVLRTQLETGCIQDFMYYAIVAKKKSVSTNMRHLLRVIHGHKIDAGVDAMLKRLYEPLLWRHLKVASAQTRHAALSLLIDAFPITDPDMYEQDHDALMQKQFDLLDDLLMDPCPHVRALTAFGTCHLLTMYWEMMPPSFIKKFLTKIVSKLAWDASSAEVRSGVTQGLTFLLDQPLSHPSLKSLLPALRMHFHDYAESVRVDYAELLLRVGRGVRSLTFLQVCPMNHIHARLAIDIECIAKRLAMLLRPSYLPPDKSDMQWWMRGVTLVHDNQHAARRFYHMTAQYHLTVGESVRFMVIVCRVILDLVRRETAQASGSDVSATGRGVSSRGTPWQQTARRGRGGRGRGRKGKRASDVPVDILEDSEDSFAEASGNQSSVGGASSTQTAAGDQSADSSQPADTTQDAEGHHEQDISTKDTELIQCFLDIVYIMWSVIEPAFKEEGCSGLKKLLEERYSEALPEFLRVFRTRGIIVTLTLIAGKLPVDEVPVSITMTTKLRKMTSETPQEDYVAILKSMVEWGKADDVLELANDWLKSGLKSADPETSLNRSTRSSMGRLASFVSPAQPELALRWLDYLLTDADLQQATLRAPSVNTLSKTLAATIKCLEKRLRDYESSGAQQSDEFLVKCLDMYVSLETMLQSEDPVNRKGQVDAVLENLVTWVEEEVLFYFRKSPTKAKRGKKKRLLAPTDATLLAGSEVSCPGKTDLSQTALGHNSGSSRDHSDISIHSGSNISPGKTTLSQTAALGHTTLATPGTTLSQTLLSTTIAGKRDANMATINELALSILATILTIAAGAVNVGQVGPECCSHLGDCAIRLLQLDEAARLLPGVTRLMEALAQIALYPAKPESQLETAPKPKQRKRRRGRITGPPTPPAPVEEQPEDCIDERLIIRLSTGLLKTLEGLVLKNREQMARVLPGLKEYVSGLLLAPNKVVLTFGEGLGQRIMHRVVGLCLRELTREIRNDVTFEAREKVTDLPVLSAFLLAIMVKSKRATLTFLHQLSVHLDPQSQPVPQFDLDTDLDGCDLIDLEHPELYRLASCLHFIHVLKAKACQKCVSIDALNEVLVTAQACLASIQLRADTSENDPSRLLYDQTQDLLNKCVASLRPAS